MIAEVINVDVTEYAVKYNILSFYEARYFRDRKKPPTRKEVVKTNIEVLNDILVRNPVIHCWCKEEEGEQNDVIIYVSNKYYWVMEIDDEVLVVRKVPVDICYMPEVDKTVEYKFNRDTEEYKFVKEWLRFFH